MGVCILYNMVIMNSMMMMMSPTCPVSVFSLHHLPRSIRHLSWSAGSSLTSMARWCRIRWTSARHSRESYIRTSKASWRYQNQTPDNARKLTNNFISWIFSRIIIKCSRRLLKTHPFLNEIIRWAYSNILCETTSFFQNILIKSELNCLGYIRKFPFSKINLLLHQECRVGCWVQFRRENTLVWRTEFTFT